MSKRPIIDLYKEGWVIEHDGRKHKRWHEDPMPYIEAEEAAEALQAFDPNASIRIIYEDEDKDMDADDTPTTTATETGTKKRRRKSTPSLVMLATLAALKKRRYTRRKYVKRYYKQYYRRKYRSYRRYYRRRYRYRR